MAAAIIHTCHLSFILQSLLVNHPHTTHLWLWTLIRACLQDWNSLMPCFILPLSTLGLQMLLRWALGGNGGLLNTASPPTQHPPLHGAIASQHWLCTDNTFTHIWVTRRFISIAATKVCLLRDLDQMSWEHNFIFVYFLSSGYHLNNCWLPFLLSWHQGQWCPNGDPTQIPSSVMLTHCSPSTWHHIQSEFSYYKRFSLCWLWSHNHILWKESLILSARWWPSWEAVNASLKATSFYIKQDPLPVWVRPIPHSVLQHAATYTRCMFCPLF